MLRLIIVFWLTFLRSFIGIVTNLLIVIIFDIVQVIVFFFMNRNGIDSNCQDRFTSASFAMGVSITETRGLLFFDKKLA